MQYFDSQRRQHLPACSLPRSQFGNWYYWDFAPTNLNAAWNRQWFDYPDMAFTDENLFVTFNMFLGNAWQRAVVFRFPLATLASGASLGYRWWATTNNGSIRLCRGAGATMYMGSHNSVSQLRVLQWPDNSTNVSWNDVNVRPWSGGRLFGARPGRRELAGPPGSAHHRCLGRRRHHRLHVVGEPGRQPPPAVHSRGAHQGDEQGADRRTGHLEPAIGMGLPRGGTEFARRRSASAPSMAAARAIRVMSWA